MDNGFFVIFIMVITYTVTKRYEAVGIAGLLMIVLFLDLVPEIFRILAGLVMAGIIAGYILKFTRGDKDSADIK